MAKGHRRNHGPKSAGDEARSEGPKPEARRAESGGGVLGEGAAAPSPPARGSGECCKLPQRGSGRSPEKNGFRCIFGLNFAVFHVLSGQNLGDE